MGACTMGRLAAVAAVLATAACAALPPARMALPEPLAAVAPEALQGVGGGREGRFEIGALQGQFVRSASRLSLFGDALAADRAALDYRTHDVTARCRARQVSAAAGVLVAAVRPFEWTCRYEGALPGELVLAADAAAPGAPSAARQGRVTLAGATLAVRSVHRVQGSPLPLERPIGYVLEVDGRPVGAVELNGPPRLWRPVAGTPLHDAVTHAALALALLWDPATP